MDRINCILKLQHCITGYTENLSFDSKNYIDGGGKLIVLLGEGGEPEFNTNINFLLEEYGMTINNG